MHAAGFEVGERGEGRGELVGEEVGLQGWDLGGEVLEPVYAHGGQEGAFSGDALFFCC